MDPISFRQLHQCPPIVADRSRQSPSVHLGIRPLSPQMRRPFATPGPRPASPTTVPSAGSRTRSSELSAVNALPNCLHCTGRAVKSTETKCRLRMVNVFGWRCARQSQRWRVESKGHFRLYSICLRPRDGRRNINTELLARCIDIPESAPRQRH